MRYTVKQLADLAGITPRTLHHYDHIGLLRPTSVGDNGYRYYDAAAVLRLQQVMFLRELDFSLAEIDAIINASDFDLLAALEQQRHTLQQRLGRLSALLQTLDRTVSHLRESSTMPTQDFFSGFDEARQSQYEEEIAATYGEVELNESRRRWGSYSPEERERIVREGEAIYREMATHIGQTPAHPAVQHLVARWHAHIRYFYPPTPAILTGLAEMYAGHPDFVALYARIHPDLPEFLRGAILHYVAHLPAAHSDLDSQLAALLDDAP